MVPSRRRSKKWVRSWVYARANPSAPEYGPGEVAFAASIRSVRENLRERETNRGRMRSGASGWPIINYSNNTRQNVCPQHSYSTGSSSCKIAWQTAQTSAPSKIQCICSSVLFNGGCDISSQQLAHLIFSPLYAAVRIPTRIIDSQNLPPRKFTGPQPGCGSLSRKVSSFVWATPSLFWSFDGWAPRWLERCWYETCCVDVDGVTDDVSTGESKNAQPEKAIITVITPRAVKLGRSHLSFFIEASWLENFVSELEREFCCT